MNKLQIAYDRGYRVTKDGYFLNPKGKVIGNNIDSRGYKQTGIIINKKYKSLYTHRLQAYQKFGDKLFKNGIVVRHLNGNKLDNSWGNIAIGTNRDNQMDISKEIRQKRCLPSIKAQIKYPKEFVLKLREEYKEVKNYSKLAIKYNIERKCMWYLINKRKVFKDA